MDTGFSAKPTVNNIGIGKDTKYKGRNKKVPVQQNKPQGHIRNTTMIMDFGSSAAVCIFCLIGSLPEAGRQSPRKQPRKSLTMSKRGAQYTVSTFEKTLQKESLASAISTLKKQCLRDPSRSIVAKELMGGLHQTNKADSNEEYWPACYGIVAKFPRNQMLALLQVNEPRLDKDKIEALKVGYSQIVAHLFEFDYGIPFKFHWPQGACHKRDVFENVLSEWRAQIGGSRISRFLGTLFISGEIVRVDWNLLGVYALAPSDTSCKTHVKHKPTGSMIPIPASMNVDDTWVFTENWSDVDAALVDADGFGRKVVTFVGCSGLPTNLSMEQWIDFASRKAAAMESTKASTNDAATLALAIVSGQRQLLSAPRAPVVENPLAGATAPGDEPLDEL